VAELEKARPRLSKIDIAICTHQDADHANGFRTFADAWYQKNRTIGEFWLPGRWAAAVPQVLLDPLDLVFKLWSGAYKAAQRLNDGQLEQPLEQCLRKLAPSEELRSAYSEVQVSKREDWVGPTDPNRRTAQSLGLSLEAFEALRRDQEEAEDSGANVLEIASELRLPYGLPWWSGDETDMRTRTLLSAAIDTAQTIQSIAKSALWWSIPIRWFDFGLFEGGTAAAGGISGLLQPVCAVELTKPPRVSPEMLFFCLRLSRQNVESLVFFRPETQTEPAVMFTGDSRLSFGLNKPETPFSLPAKLPKRPVLVTAPHHGSRVNDCAYEIITRWLGEQGPQPIYVRNGGHWKQSLSAFLKQDKRLCARCSLCDSGTISRRVTLRASGGRWDLGRTRRCR
jgi:hypothetical protein